MSMKTIKSIKERRLNNVFSKWDVFYAYGIGIYEATQLVLLVLKLLFHISWKWIWVLAPSWIIGVCFFVYFAGSIVLEKIRDRWYFDA